MSSAKNIIWKTMRTGLKRRGIDAYLAQPGYHYVPDYYGRTAWKHLDIRTVQPFGDLAKEAIGHKKALLYYDRLYPIFQSLRNIERLPRPSGGVNIAEVGVYRGGTSWFMASVLRALDITPATLHCFDTFEGHATEDIEGAWEGTHRAGKFNDTSFEGVKDYLKVFDNIRFHKGRVQDTAEAAGGGLTFQFAHLDVDIYEPMIYALHFFGDRLQAGGAMIVDDYGFRTCPGTKQAVDEFAAARHDFFALHLLSGQCLLVRQQGGPETHG
jgi:hypothetical protein